MNEVINKLEKRATEIANRLSDELAKVRTGRAAPAILDSVRVDAYGSLMPINQVASVTTEDARTLRVNPWDTSLKSAVEGAIEKADLGVSVSSNDQGIRVHFPELTTETREKIAKAAKQKHEEARVALRQERESVRQELQKAQKEGELSEDEKSRLEEKIEKIMTDTNKILDDKYEHKYKELTTI